jgi:chromosome segregation ATPase
MAKSYLQRQLAIVQRQLHQARKELKKYQQWDAAELADMQHLSTQAKTKGLQTSLREMMLDKKSDLASVRDDVKGVRRDILEYEREIADIRSTLR